MRSDERVASGVVVRVYFGASAQLLGIRCSLVALVRVVGHSGFRVRYKAGGEVGSGAFRRV